VQVRRPERVAYCHSFGGSASRKKEIVATKRQMRDIFRSGGFFC
jgi:hypothetical protein